jgi:hypothetical protein
VDLEAWVNACIECLSDFLPEMATLSQTPPFLLAAQENFSTFEMGPQLQESEYEGENKMPGCLNCTSNCLSFLTLPVDIKADETQTVLCH